MARGESALIGSERISKNGYTYVKTVDVWRLKHHIIAEKKYGRSIDTKTERVIFKDHDRNNFDPDNIIIEKKKGITKGAQLARLKTRREELEAQIAELEDEGEEAS
jgi:hypothetical protein